MGVWGAIANKTEASQNNMISGQKLPKPSSRLSNDMFLKRKLLYSHIFSKAIGKEMTLIYGGLGSIAPRSQRHFKESDEMED